jgi:hypothetical protein
MPSISEQIETSSSPSITPTSLPGAMRLTQEQLAAAQRTREYHLQKLQSRIADEFALESEPVSRSEH